MTGPLSEIVATFAKLGCVSFGGPIAHLGYLRDELVEKRRWLGDDHYADLVALCQFLPGPASSQLVFALGMLRGGLAGALAASLCFTLPSALLMIGFAYGVGELGDLRGAGWLHGLGLAAVAVVARAVWGMGKTLCLDRARISIAIASTGVVLVVGGALSQIAVIAGGAGLGWLLYRRDPDMTAAPDGDRPALPRRAGIVALAMFLALLIALPLLRSVTTNREIAELDAFYRSGSLVFGGGHVILPLLQAEVVPTGWVTPDQFLAGYGAVQAVPGPLFTFAAYLGAAMDTSWPAWANGLWCMAGLFLPSWLLVSGALPFWHRLREEPGARAALAGANAAVVGMLLAALYDPLIREAVTSSRSLVAVLVGFTLLEHWKTPPWLIVAAFAATGPWLLV